MKEQKASFVKNAAILSFARVFSRMLGALYKIPLFRILSSEGIGIYNLGYNVYALLLAISTAGVPVAVSKLVSEEVSRNRVSEAIRVFKIATFLLAIIGGSFTIGLVALSPIVARLIIQEPRASLSLLAIAPAILIVALLSSYKGFFQGLQQMWPTAISQILEQIAKIITILILTFYLFKVQVKEEIMVAGAIFGSTIGSLVGLLIILYMYKKSKDKIKALKRKYPATSRKSGKEIAYKILRYSIPVTLGAIILPVIRLIDLMVIRQTLEAVGYLHNDALALYGEYSANTSLINIPAMLSGSLAASLVPAISAARAKKKHKTVADRTSLSLKIIIIIGLSSAVGLSVMSAPITSLVYAKVGIRAEILEILAFAVIFLTLHQVCTGILQGQGYTKIPVKNLVIGGIVKTILNLTLLRISFINIKGAAISSVMAYLVSSLLNLKAVLKYTNAKLEWSHMIIKPVIATILMAITTKLTYIKLSVILGNTVSTLISITIAIVVFLLSLLVTRCFSKKELQLIPGFNAKLIGIVDSLHFLRRD